MRICFAGTPVFAAAHLQALLKAGHHVTAVYTQPDRPAGRGKKLQASPVKQIALENELLVFQPASLRPVEEVELLSSLNIDLMIVVAYGLILPQSILDIPRLGCLNVHASLLPRWRGAAPIERALLAGDKESGVTIMQMDEGLDTGAMLNKEVVQIGASDNRIDLENKLQIAGQTALLRALDNLESYQSQATIQDDEESSHAAKLDKSEALIDWSLSASEIDRQVRAGIGRNPAYAILNGRRLRILEASVSPDKHSVEPGQIVENDKAHFMVSCGVGVLTVHRVQLPGKNAAAVKDVSNSRPGFVAPGVTFDCKQSK